MGAEDGAPFFTTISARLFTLSSRHTIASMRLRAPSAVSRSRVSTCACKAATPQKSDHLSQARPGETDTDRPLSPGVTARFPSEEKTPRVRVAR